MYLRSSHPHLGKKAPCTELIAIKEMGTDKSALSRFLWSDHVYTKQKTRTWPWAFPSTSVLLSPLSSWFDRAEDIEFSMHFTCSFPTSSPPQRLITNISAFWARMLVLGGWGGGSLSSGSCQVHLRIMPPPPSAEL